MFDEHIIVQAHDICHDPTSRRSMTRKSSVQDHVVSFSHSESVLIAKRRGKCPGQIKESASTASDMGAVLDVIGRPVDLRSYLVSPVEERVESLENSGFIFERRRFDQLSSSILITCPRDDESVNHEVFYAASVLQQRKRIAPRAR